MNGGGNQTFHKDYLTTGGAGFTGANIVPCWLNSNLYTQVTELDAFTYEENLQNLENLKENKVYSFVHDNIIDSLLENEFFIEFGGGYATPIWFS